MTSPSYQFPTDESLQLPNLTARESVGDVKIDESLSEEQNRQVRKLLAKYKTVLTDVPGRCYLAQHDIKLTSFEPVSSKPYPLPHAFRDTVCEEIKSMLDMGVIERSNSPYASPIVLVGKKDGTQRFCIDFKRLNRVTVFDAEPKPDGGEYFSKLLGYRYFTKLDLSKGVLADPTG